jgi:sirohydrochlorin ferrochelatase
MIASAANSPEFLIASDLLPGDASWPAASAQVEEVRAACAKILGFEPAVRLVSMTGEITPSRSEVFVIPAVLDFSLVLKARLGQLIAEARRASPRVAIHHDNVDVGHPLVVSAFADRIGRALTPHCGLVLAASGHGDPASRAESYRLMRLVWEELSLRKAEVGFVRHAMPFLGQVLESCLQDRIRWLVAPLNQWESEHTAYARVILENLKRAYPDQAQDWTFVDPPGAHPALTAWYTQRITRLWQQKRERESVRVRSAFSGPASEKQTWSYGKGLIARVADHDTMAEVLRAILPPGKPDRVLVKVTWHGYATGTYTDPAALDLLLGALPAQAIILEGHTSSRNRGDSAFDWETEAQANRAWIRQQEAEYLGRTGLAEVMARHKAQYVNVTEACWDGEPVPNSLLDYKGCPMISYAKMKGPTRLGISNLFGLIPEPLRSRWHGPNITYFARVCCDLEKQYGSLFPLYGMVEGLYSAVRWNRRGLYRSRWGNYDLISNAGYLTASAGLVTADILASRLQGQDVLRSAFFDVVREELGWDGEAAEQALPEELVTIFA